MQSAAALHGKQIGTFFTHQRADFFKKKRFNEPRFKRRQSLKKAPICFQGVTQVPPETPETSEVRLELLGLKESAVL